MTRQVPPNSIPVGGAPAGPGLRFRHFAGPSDYPIKVDILNESNEADQIAYVTSITDTEQRFLYEMVRPDLENIPELPQPEGLEIRPSDRSQSRTIFGAAAEAFADHWGEGEWTDEAYQEWQAHQTFNLALWQVAGNGEEIASDAA